MLWDELPSLLLGELPSDDHAAKTGPSLARSLVGRCEKTRFEAVCHVPRHAATNHGHEGDEVRREREKARCHHRVTLRTLKHRFCRYAQVREDVLPKNYEIKKFEERGGLLSPAMAKEELALAQRKIGRSLARAVGNQTNE